MTRSMHCYAKPKVVSVVSMARAPWHPRPSHIPASKVVLAGKVWLLIKCCVIGILAYLSTCRTMRLDPGDVVKPYVSVSGDVAHADTRRLLDDCERQLSGKSRRVEDPVVVKTRSIEVSLP